MTSLGIAFNQADPLLKPGDIDDCWCVAAIQAATAVGGSYTKPDHINVNGLHVPTIPAFRKYAQRPDVQGVSNGGQSSDVLRGANGAWPELQILLASTSWSTFVHEIRDLGWVAALAVKSGLLPSTLRYGFLGLHEISVAAHGTGFAIVNPLQPKGSAPKYITEAALKAAAVGFAGGKISGVLFKAAPAPIVLGPNITPPPPVVVPPVVVPAVNPLQATVDQLKANVADRDLQIALLTSRVVKVKDLARQIEVI